MLRAEINGEAFFEKRRFRDEQIVFLLDDATDEIGQPAICEGRERAAFEDDDLRGFIHAAQARGTRGATRDAADDDDGFGR